MRTILPCLVAVGLVAAVPLTADAFDGKRKGFVLSMGMGVGSVTLDRTVGGKNRGETAGAFLLEGRIGRGVTDRFLLYFASSTALSAESAVEHEEFGLGWSAYFSEEPQSFYALGVVGFTTYDANGIPSHTGPGVSGGMGWQFSRFWSLEGTVRWGSADRKEVPNAFLNLTEPGPALESSTVSAALVVCGSLY
jgi:hypothetical protein